jgi:hypothetical protein
LTQKCLHKGLGASTAVGIHAAWTAYWDNMWVLSQPISEIVAYYLKLVQEQSMQENITMMTSKMWLPGVQHGHHQSGHWSRLSELGETRRVQQPHDTMQRQW